MGNAKPCRGCGEECGGGCGWDALCAALTTFGDRLGIDPDLVNEVLEEKLLDALFCDGWEGE